MKKKVLIWVLAAVLVLSMAGCAAGAVLSLIHISEPTRRS